MSKKISAHNATVISKQKAPGVNVTQSTVAEGVTVTMTHIDVPTTFIFDVENANITTAYKFTLDITNSANVRYAIRILASTTSIEVMSSHVKLFCTESRMQRS